MGKEGSPVGTEHVVVIDIAVGLNVILDGAFVVAGVEDIRNTESSMLEVDNLILFLLTNGSRSTDYLTQPQRND